MRRLTLPCWLAFALYLVTPASAETTDKRLREALDKVPHPNSAADFQAAPSLPCLNQKKTLICWSFATCSFLESEMARLKLPPVRLSVMFPAYCQYLEKARRFAQTKGTSRFSPGDTFCGVADACAAYGAMPASAYEKSSDGKAFDQTRLYADLEKFIKDVKLRGQWDEALVVSRVRKILDRHLGAPPESFTFNGTTCTSKSFLADVVRLPWTEYVMVTSFGTAPFNTFTELKVPDNWRHHTNFFNVPLPVFYDALKTAVRASYTVAVEVDNTEPSYQTTGRYCFIPDYDIPFSQVTQGTRDLGFLNGETTDDHVVHFIGFANIGGEDWFLAKDSWRVTWRGGNQGSIFLHSTYVKLKVLAFIVHRNGVPQITPLLPPPTARR